MLLRDGSETRDQRLDRLVHFDARSRSFPIREVVPETLHRGRTWPCAAYLDQGREGACVGFAWAHELRAIPAVHRVTDRTALDIYRSAQRIDEWPGEAYSGTSVLAGAKVVQDNGWIGEYRWAFGIDDVLRTLAHQGPAVLGIPWLDSMYDPRPSGLMDCSGQMAGGHAILARGVILSPRLPGERLWLGGKAEPVVRLRNSWGEGWGKRGDCYVKASDLERLLQRDGECCVPVERTRPK